MVVFKQTRQENYTRLLLLLLCMAWSQPPHTFKVAKSAMQATTSQTMQAAALPIHQAAMALWLALT